MEKDTPETILRELATHLVFDADVNGSTFTERPVGSVVLSKSEGSLWKRVVDVLGGEPDPSRDQVQAVRARLHGDHGPVRSAGAVTRDWVDG